MSYLIGQKFVGQNCRNFGLVSKILSDEKFCPSKILSNNSIQKSGKNRTKFSKVRLGVENFSDEILSDKVCEITVNIKINKKAAKDANKMTTTNDNNVCLNQIKD